MAGSFSNTNYTQTIESLVKASTDKLVNPYYSFCDQKPTTVTYYAQNVEKSTLDQASGLYGAHVGDQSPFKFNKIKSFCLYGIDKITTDYEVGDYGTEAASITGDAIVLPNTIIPRPGDFFSISYIKEPLLFKVNAATPDTLDNGSNVYKIEYALELTNAIESIEAQVVKEYTFVMNNVGTDLSMILEDGDLELASNIETLIGNLITCFQSIFFDDRLQTFVYNHNGWHIYDPYLIEFLIRNKVLNFGGEYVYVSHATTTGKLFGVEYLKTIFYCLENPGNKLEFSNFVTADLIRDPNSLFVTRMEYYYKVRYIDNTPYKTRFQIIDPEVVEHIQNNTMYDSGDDKEIYNLWIAYFNDGEITITSDIIDQIMKIEYMDNLNYFYTLAITIFILERYVVGLLSNK